MLKELLEKQSELLDDPEYSSDAIPVAAECGMPAAKEWFLNLSKKPVEEIRKFKTNDYVNGFFCLLMYSSKHIEFLKFLKELYISQNLTNPEYLDVVNKIAIHDPKLVLDDYKKIIFSLLEGWGNSKVNKKFIVYDTLGVTFERLGLENCLNVGKRMKNEMPQNIHQLYYDSLKLLPKYLPYLEDLKKILEIKG